MNTLKYFLLFLLLFSSILVWGQASSTEDTTQTDLKPDLFIRLGFDLSAIGRNLAEKQVQQYEFTLDSEVYRNVFASFESGMASVSNENDDFEYSSSGIFFRTGADYNLLKRRTKSSHDLVFIGLRYGYSLLQHSSERFRISNPYWGEYTGAVDKSNFNLHWVELNGGVKTEAFKNLYLGWTLRTRIKISQTKDPVLQPYFIGGFGHGNRRSPVSIHFYISYRFGLK